MNFYESCRKCDWPSALAAIEAGACPAEGFLVAAEELASWQAGHPEPTRARAFLQAMAVMMHRLSDPPTIAYVQHECWASGNPFLIEQAAAAEPSLSAALESLQLY